MIPFLWILVIALVIALFWGVAKATTHRKRASQSGQAEVNAQQVGAGAPKFTRARGDN